MTSTPLSSPAGLMSVSASLASIGQNITRGCDPSTEDMGTKLNFEEEKTGFAPANNDMIRPFKAEQQEGGLCTYGLQGWRGAKAVPLVLLTPKKNEEFCLSCIGWD
jgi:hypothetical protein